MIFKNNFAFIQSMQEQPAVFFYGTAFFAVFLICMPLALAAESFTADRGKITFISTMDEEKITGGGNRVTGFVDFDKSAIEIKVDLGDWTTGSKLQTMHLHEDYLETDIYPVSIFRGEIQKDKDVVRVEGMLELHGVKRNISAICKLEKMENDTYHMTTQFELKLTDYNIKIPSLLIMKLNNEISVKVDINLRPR